VLTYPLGSSLCLLAVAAPCAAQEFELFAHDYAWPENDALAEPPGAAWTAAVRPGVPPPSFRESLYLPMMREAEVRYGLPSRLFQALIWAESRFDPLAISPARAAGLAQLTPAAAREFGVINRQDPVQSIDGGGR
jgi:soluble lytic murein transglycosylase-like protein